MGRYVIVLAIRRGCWKTVGILVWHSIWVSLCYYGYTVYPVARWEELP